VNKQDRQYLRRAAKIALKSGCVRAKRGAILVKDGKVAGWSFNLVLPKNDVCQKGGCLRDKMRLGLGKEPQICRSIHAEARVIAQAAKKGIGLNGAKAYITSAPCINCAKVLWVAGIGEVYFIDKHADKTGTVFLERMGVGCRRVKVEGDRQEQRLRDTSKQ